MTPFRIGITITQQLVVFIMDWICADTDVYMASEMIEIADAIYK